MDKPGGTSPLFWIFALAVVMMSVRACGGPEIVDVAGKPIEFAVTRPDGPGTDFAMSAESRFIELPTGQRIDEIQVAEGMRTAGYEGKAASFSWNYDDRIVSTVAPGLDRRHHFANAYLVGYMPYSGVDAWVALYSLSRSKTYQFDHDQYPGSPELWQTSREAFFYPSGDCEDHAIALADWLIGLGHDARVVIGRVRGDGHAWVVINEGNRTWLLEATDKRPGKALPLAMQHPEYQPEAMFNRDTYWVNAGTVLTTDYRGPHWEPRSRFIRNNQTSPPKTGSG